MLQWAIISFIIAIIASMFAFGGIATAITTFVQIVFWIFLASGLITFIAYLFRDRPISQRPYRQYKDV